MSTPYAGRATFTATPPTACRAGKRVRWTMRMKAQFLDRLAATCDISKSARALGLDPSSVYHLRRHDAEFAAQWELAIDSGCQILETLLVGHALSGEAGTRLTGGDPDLPPINVDLAFRVLQARRNRLNGKRPTGGPPFMRANKRDTENAILKKLAAIEAKAAQ